MLRELVAVREAAFSRALLRRPPTPAIDGFTALGPGCEFEFFSRNSRACRALRARICGVSLECTLSASGVLDTLDWFALAVFDGVAVKATCLGGTNDPSLGREEKVVVVLLLLLELLVLLFELEDFCASLRLAGVGGIGLASGLSNVSKFPSESYGSRWLGLGVPTV